LLAHLNTLLSCTAAGTGRRNRVLHCEIEFGKEMLDEDICLHKDPA
jgi:hypothetical protein